MSRTRFTSILASAVAVGALVLSAGDSATQAAIIYVKHDATGANTGTSWSDACVYLQDGLAKAAAGDEIWVAEGRYTPDRGTGITPLDRNATFALRNMVYLYGGFAGTETERTQRDWRVNITTLSGDLLGDDGPNFANREDNSLHVVRVEGLISAATSLDGFTIRGGNANSPDGWGNSGGGLLFRQSLPRLRNLIVTDNSGQYGGALAYGFIQGAEPPPPIEDCTFRQNRAISAVIGVAGEQLPYFYGCRIEDNLTMLDQPALDIVSSFDASVVIADCVFARNTGDGLRLAEIFGTEQRVERCDFIANTGRGAFCRVMPFRPLFDNCRFLGNGGGIYSEYSEIVLRNCLLTGNVSYIGAAVQAYNTPGSMFFAPVHLIQCTVTGNHATSAVGGVAFVEAPWPGVSIHVHNSIVWNNTDPNGNGLTAQVRSFDPDAVLDVKYSCVNHAYELPSAGNIAVDPQFVDRDGPDNIYGTPDDDLHLLPTSPAIDAGWNLLLPGEMTADLDGLPRRFDVPGAPDTGAGAPPIVDMGAYESQALVWARGDMSCDGRVNNFDIDPFVLALLDPAGFQQAYPSCEILNADMNRDGLVNDFDIDPFVALILGL